MRWTYHLIFYLDGCIIYEFGSRVYYLRRPLNWYFIYPCPPNNVGWLYYDCGWYDQRVEGKAKQFGEEKTQGFVSEDTTMPKKEKKK